MNKGFIPAIATPLDENGYLMEESYRKQIECMIQAGATALLCMGSMGQQAYIRSSECVKVAACAVDAAAGRVPVYVGVMDNSIARAKERMAAMEHLNIAAFVFTTPYYSISGTQCILNFFRSVGAATKRDIMLYDLPSVTQAKITYKIVVGLKSTMKNLAGIKTNDLQLLRKLHLNDLTKDMNFCYSGLDTFDIAYPWGIGSILDGMFCCVPKNATALVNALENGDKDAAAKALSNIVDLRDLFLANDLWPSFSYAMNLLGFDGNHSPDWSMPIAEASKAVVLDAMKKIGEIA